MIELRLPYITSPTPEGQMLQLRSYLQQLVPELQHAFELLEANLTATPSKTVEAVRTAPSAHTGVRKLKNEDAFAIKTRYPAFVEGGTGVQTFFIFGAVNDTIIQGVALVKESGTANWQGTEGVVVSTIAGGKLAVVLPSASSDIITVISGQKFNV